MTSSPNRRFISVVGAAILREDLAFLVRRPPSDTGAGFWEFPGGKIELGEAPEQALHREIDEELGLKIRIVGDLGKSLHSYDTADIELRIFVCEIIGGQIELREHDAMKWVSPDQILEEELLPNDRPFVQRLRDKTGF